MEERDLVVKTPMPHMSGLFCFPQKQPLSPDPADLIRLLRAWVVLVDRYFADEHPHVILTTKRIRSLTLKRFLTFPNKKCSICSKQHEPFP
jgi:hypothetical protein